MAEHSIIVWLLPMVFILHDFEEIIFMRSWLDRNRSDLERRFPKIAPRLLGRVGSLSIAGFALAVAEEFALLGAITLCAVATDWYGLWLAAFIGFALHLLVHIGQWIAVRRYIPAIGTTILALAYCGWALYKIITVGLFSLLQIAVWTVVGVVLMVANLLLAHKLANWFDKKMKHE